MKKNNTLSLTLIVKNEARNIPNVLKNAHLFADEIIIVDTGSSDNTKEICQQFTDNVLDFEWCDDFAKARNYGIQRCTKDFIMWLDADDTVSRKDALSIKELIKNPIHWDMLYIPYYYSNDTIVPRERIFRNNHGFHFKFPIHECVSFSRDFQSKHIDHIVIKHNYVHPKWENSNDRNLRILKKSVQTEEYKNEYRMWWHLGREYKDYGKTLEAIDAYKQSLTLKNIHPAHVSTIYYELGVELAKLKDFVYAIPMVEKAIEVCPEWKEPFFECGLLYFQQNEHLKAIEMFKKALALSRPKNPVIQIFNQMLYQNHILHDWLSNSYGAVGNYENAIKHANQALALNHPEADRIKDNKKQFQKFL